MIRSGSLGLGLVWPLCPFGLPGKRFALLLWSPLRVGYIRIEGGVCGFSWRMTMRLSWSFSALSLAFSSVSFMSFWHCWQVWQVDVALAP